MPEEHKTVFINYRRKTSAYVARAIFEHLRSQGYDVFMDVENIDSGTFDTIILNQIKARAHFLAILSPGSLDDCNHPGDWVRREIEYAIEQGRNVVPIMAGGFKFENYREYLTGKLSELPRYSGLPLYHEYFDEGMARLRTRYLKQPTPGSIQPAPADEQPSVQRKLEKTVDHPAPTETELTAEELFWSGLDKQEAGNLGGAIADYDEAIRLNPQYTDVYIDRGNALAELGNLDAAVADYNEAIRLDPQYALAYSNRGEARRCQGNLDGAISDFDAAIRLNPQFAGAYSNRGHTRYHQNDLMGAIADLTKAIQLNPQYTDAYINRGEAHFAKQQYEPGLADFKQSLKLNPQDKWGMAGLAVTLHALGRVDEAKAQWRELTVQDTRYRNVDWVGQEFHWHPVLVEEAHRLIASLDRP